eukprot:scaffold2804_cov181-Amphora_coffeaeformis.AAC.29
MNSSCWGGLSVKGLGIGIIMGSCLNKAPMVYNIWTSKSTEGLSGSALYGEIISLANASFYGFLMSYPFTSYGEAIALAVQVFIIIMLNWVFAKPPVSMTEKIAAAGAAAFYLVGVLYILPPEQYSLLMGMMWPLQVYAKGAQIYESFRIKHTGSMAVATICMNVVGSFIRILTTIGEIGFDFAMLTGSILAVVLNSIMLFQYFLYRKNTEKFLQDLEKKKTD